MTSGPPGRISPALPKQAVDVVFLGDSITEYGLWNEWFPRHHVVNRGIAADTSGGVLGRIGTAVGKQHAVSLLIGTNDLSFGISPGRIAANIAAILSAIRAADPGTRILLNSVMPRTRAYRTQIIALNQKLAPLAETDDVTFLDLWPVLADGQGAIRPEFSTDQVHLTRAGYAAWVEALREHIAPMAPQNTSVLKQHLDALCDELAAVIEDAAACGNEVTETWTGFGQAVRLRQAQPVLTGIPADVLAKLTYRSVRDPHYWLGEIHCRTHPGWFVALPFSTPDAQEPVGLPPT